MNMQLRNFPEPITDYTKANRYAIAEEARWRQRSAAYTAECEAREQMHEHVNAAANTKRHLATLEKEDQAASTREDGHLTAWKERRDIARLSAANISDQARIVRETFEFELERAGIDEQSLSQERELIAAAERELREMRARLAGIDQAEMRLTAAATAFREADRQASNLEERLAAETTAVREARAARARAIHEAQAAIADLEARANEARQAHETAYRALNG